MPKYSGFDPIESHDVLTTGSSTSSIEHAGNAEDTVLYLPFDDDVNDDSLFNQTITNRAYNGNPITVDSTYAKFGGKSLRSWTGSSLKIHNSSSMDLDTPFTVEFFFRTNNSLSNIALYTHNDINSGSSNYSGLLFWIAGDNTLRLYGSSNGSSWNIFQNPAIMATISANNWHHVAITYDGSSYRGYYNGVRKWARSSSTTLPTGGHSYILSRNEGGQYQAGTDNVRIDDFRITKGVALYTGSTYTVPTSALGLHQNDAVSLYLPFDSDVNDDSEHGHTVTASGSATISSTQAKFGGNSLSLNGTNQYLTVPNDSSFQFGSSDFTVEAWVYQTAAAGTSASDRHAIVARMDGASNRSFHVGIVQGSGGTQALEFGYTTDGDSGTAGQYTFQDDVTGDITINNWHHIAIVRSGTNLYGFVNGIILRETITGNGGAISSKSIYGGTSDLTVGYRGLSTQYFEGYIDDLRITKGVARYTKSFVPPSQAVGARLTGENKTRTTTAHTSLYLPLDSDQNDDSPYSSSTTVYLTGDASISSAQSKFGGNSLALDGNGDYLHVNPFGRPIYFDDFTIEAWIYPTTISNYQTIFDSRQGASSGPGMTIQIQPAGTIQVYAKTDGGIHNFSTTQTVSANEWTHLAVVRRGRGTNETEIFINGTSAATGSITHQLNQTNFNIGLTPDGYYFNGYIDDYRILKFAKYNADFVPPSSAHGTSISETENDLTVLYLPFDGTESSSSTASDLYLPFDSDLNDDSSNASTGTASGGAAISSTQSKFGGYSLYLDGTNDYVTYDNLALGTDDFTIEAFIYDTKSSGYREIVNTYHTGANGEWLFRINSSGGNNDRLGFSYRTGGGWATSINSPTNSISQNTWYHVAAVRSGDTLTLYIDGTAVVSGSVSSLNGVNKEIQLGTYSSGAGQFFGGYIDDLRITKAALYTSNFTVPTSALGATETVTTLQGGFEDQARNHGVTKNGNATLNTNVKKFGTSSAYFDGTGDYLTIPHNGNFEYGADAFTIEFWMYPTSSVSGDRIIYNKRANSGTYGSIYIAVKDGNIVAGATKTGSNWDLISVNTAFGSVAVNTWYHVALVRNSDGSFVGYLNGVGTSLSTDTASITSNSTDVHIGGDTNTNQFSGYIDDLRIIKGHARYTANFTAPTSALGSEVSNTTTTVTTDTKTLSSTWTMTNDDSSPRSFIDMRSDNTWANNEHLQSSPDHRWNPAHGSPDTVATGGSIATPGNGYKYHVFTSPGTFQLSSIDGSSPTLAVEYLVVAGGGGGAGNRGGGAGAGGFRTNEDGNPKAGAAMNITTGSFPVVVGTGGAAGYWPSPSTSHGLKGGASSFNGIQSTGGGGGGGPSGPGDQGTGGSGGGAFSVTGPSGFSGNTPPTTPPQGNPGGAGHYPQGAGGGGGAGAAGGAGNPNAGDGGAGHAVPSFSGPILSPAIPGSMATAIGPTGLYAGGGGGGGSGEGPDLGGTGGPGGGGNGGHALVNPGSYNPNSGEYGPAGAPGVDGTGGGGGGAGNSPGTNPNMRPGGDGGNGVVIIKYAY